MSISATFAVPGDIDTPTGGYIYEKELLLALRRIGVRVAHLQLPGGFPDASVQTMEAVANELGDLPAGQPVILDGFLPGALPPLYLNRLRAPFVAVTHHPLCYETGIDPARARALRDIERSNLNRAAHVIVPSPHTAEMLISDFGVPETHVTVAPPGVVRPTSNVRAPRGDTEILCVAQLVPRKGHETLLSALGMLKDLDWKATFVGRDTDAGYGRGLRKLAAREGISERVHFAGLVDPEKLSEFYARASVFALATHYEGYGMVFAEAMVHGLPIVTCDGGAVPDTVPKDVGTIVPVADDIAFADALRQVLSNQNIRRDMSDASAKRGRALPHWDDTARIVRGVLERVTPQT